MIIVEFLRLIGEAVAGRDLKLTINIENSAFLSLSQQFRRD